MSLQKTNGTEHNFSVSQYFAKSSLYLSNKKKNNYTKKWGEKHWKFNSQHTRMSNGGNLIEQWGIFVFSDLTPPPHTVTLAMRAIDLNFGLGHICPNQTSSLSGVTHTHTRAHECRTREWVRETQRDTERACSLSYLAAKRWREASEFGVTSQLLLMTFVHRPGAYAQ